MKRPHSPIYLLFALAAGLVLLQSASMAQTAWWTNNSGSWNVDGNWTADAPTSSTVATFGNNPSDSPVTITLGPGANVHQMTFSNTGNRSYTFSGDTLTFTGQVGSDPRILTSNVAGLAAITIDADIFFTHAVAGTDTRFVIGGTQNSTSRFSTITINGDIRTDAPGEGIGARQMAILSSADTKIILKGASSATHTLLSGEGEVIVENVNALGLGSLQRSGSNNSLSLRGSDLIIGSAAGYSWTSNTYVTTIRISETEMSSTDRTITMTSRMIGSGGGLQWTDNLNSTGKLILDLLYAGGNAQSANLTTNSSAIVRFSQHGTTTFSGAISGEGSLEVVAGGTTVLSSADTYTGRTTLTNNSTLSLSGAGAISGTSELSLAAGTTFNISGITAGSYTFGADQEISGTGTIVTGGKNLVINGTIDPGNSPGTLTLNLGTGTLFLGESGDLQFELGTVSDLILLSSGFLDIGDETLEFGDFSFTALDGFGVGEYVLFETFNTIAGELGGNVTGFVGGYASELKISGNNLILEVVPEPSSIVMVALAGLLLGGVVLRARRHAIGS